MPVEGGGYPQKSKGAAVPPQAPRPTLAATRVRGTICCVRSRITKASCTSYISNPFTCSFPTAEHFEKLLKPLWKSMNGNILHPGERDRENQKTDWPRAKPHGDLAAEMGMRFQEGVCLCPPPFILYLTPSSSTRCINTVLPAHTALCKLFKYGSGWTQTSFYPQTSRGETGHSQRREQLFFSKLQSRRCWERDGGDGERKERVLL